MEKNKMGYLPMGKLILSMSLPAMFSMFISSLYNIVDGIFVAKLSSDAFIAVSLALPIQILLISFSVGTSVGLNSLISRRLGEQKQDDADNAATHGLFLSIIMWFFFAILGILLSRPFMVSMTENPLIRNMGTQYVSIVTILSLGLFVQINFEKTLQATGNMLYPMLFQLIGAITNIILDPILIYGLFGVPKMGVAGAAIATVIGQMLGMLFSSYIMFAKTHKIKFKFKKFKPQLSVIKDIYAVGLPAIIMQAISSLLMTGLNAILISYSDTAVFILGIYYKLQTFIFMPVFGLMQGVLPVLGYNYGAKNKERLFSALKIGSYIALIIMVLGTLSFQIIPGTLLGIFDADAEAMKVGIPALRIISICFIPAAMGIMFSTFFQAIGNGFTSLVVSVLRQLVIILPITYLLAKYFGVENCWFAFPIAEIIALSFSTYCLLKLIRGKLNLYFN